VSPHRQKIVDIPFPRHVIPVKTGIQTLSLRMQGARNIINWVPVFTGNPGFLPLQELQQIILYGGLPMLKTWWGRGDLKSQKGIFRNSLTFGLGFHGY